jgi:hypothetical protein
MVKTWAGLVRQLVLNVRACQWPQPAREPPPDNPAAQGDRSVSILSNSFTVQPLTVLTGFQLLTFFTLGQCLAGFFKVVSFCAELFEGPSTSSDLIGLKHRSKPQL